VFQEGLKRSLSQVQVELLGKTDQRLLQYKAQKGELEALKEQVSKLAAENHKLKDDLNRLPSMEVYEIMKEDIVQLMYENVILRRELEERKDSADRFIMHALEEGSGHDPTKCEEDFERERGSGQYFQPQVEKLKQTAAVTEAQLEDLSNKLASAEVKEDLLHNLQAKRGSNASEEQIEQSEMQQPEEQEAKILADEILNFAQGELEKQRAIGKDLEDHMATLEEQLLNKTQIAEDVFNVKYQISKLEAEFVKSKEKEMHHEQKRQSNQQTSQEAEDLICYHLAEIERLRDELEEAMSKIEKLQEEAAQCEAENETLNAKLEYYKQQIRVNCKEINVIIGQLKALEDGVQTQDILQAHNEEISSLKKYMHDVDAREEGKQDLEEKLSQHEEKIDRMNYTKQELQSETRSIIKCREKEIQHEQERQLNLQTSEGAEDFVHHHLAAIERLRAELVEAVDKIAKLQEEAAQCEAENDALNTKLECYKQKIRVTIKK
jgi:cell division protein FtsB